MLFVVEPSLNKGSESCQVAYEQIYLCIPKFRVCFFSDKSQMRKFIFLRKTIINKSLGFIAFAHYPNIVLSFFKNNPNTSLPKLHTDLSSEIKELF